ncbi:MAG: VanZ family protein [Verrucomicrobia bacterium]|nr:VanZ family protein [Verrucomicrobiota bacterium]
MNGIMTAKWKILFLAYCGTILYLSSLSPNELPEGPALVSDKVLHLCEYGLFGILSWGAFAVRKGVFPWGLVVLGAWFGIMDECWQDWIGKSRSAEVWDAAADDAGSLLGVTVAQLFWIKR